MIIYVTDKNVIFYVNYKLLAYIDIGIDIESLLRCWG